MPHSLLDKQVSLLEYLTSGGAIFDDGSEGRLDRWLGGIDRRLLHLEARFSFQKRLGKIFEVFPVTTDLLEGHLDATGRAFAEAYPPTDIGRLENARQFYAFLCTDAPSMPILPPYLRDIAAIELAFARARGGSAVVARRYAHDGPRGAVRRHTDAILIRCAYDVGPIFEHGAAAAAPVKRETPVGIGIPRNSTQPQVFELLGGAFELLEGLNEWTDLPAVAAEADGSALVSELAFCGLIEVHP